MSQSDVDRIFDRDEMVVPKIQKHWSREDILNQEGLFFFKDIAKTLMLEASAIKSLVEVCLQRGGDPWEEMGIKKVWSHWMVRMKTFAPLYRGTLQPRYQSVAKTWDGNTLLRQNGIFLLTEVCRKIPFTAGQLRHQVRQNPNAEAEYGIWKDTELGVFLVRMERFSPWVQRLWSEGFTGSKPAAKQPKVSTPRQRAANRTQQTPLAKPAKPRTRTRKSKKPVVAELE